MAMRSNVLSMYRRMLRVASRLGDTDRTKAERKIRDGFRRWSGVRESDTVTQLLEDAERKIAVMHMKTPKWRRHPEEEKREISEALAKYADDGTQRYATGSTTYVAKDGKLVGGKAAIQQKARYSNWGMDNLDPEDISRHKRNLRRFQFLDRPGGPPKSPFLS